MTAADGSAIPPPEPRKRNKVKKEDDGAEEPATEGGEAKKKTRSRKKKAPTKTWYSELTEDVQTAMANKSIVIEAGRVFVSVGDARFKVGTGGYITLAHKSGVVAEGSYTSDPEGKIVVTWEHVLKLDGEEWKVSTAADEDASLVKEILLTDGK